MEDAAQVLVFTIPISISRQCFELSPCRCGEPRGPCNRTLTVPELTQIFV